MLLFHCCFSYSLFNFAILISICLGMVLFAWSFLRLYASSYNGCNGWQTKWLHTNLRDSRSSVGPHWGRSLSPGVADSGVVCPGSSWFVGEWDLFLIWLSLRFGVFQSWFWTSGEWDQMSRWLDEGPKVPQRYCWPVGGQGWVLVLSRV